MPLLFDVKESFAVRALPLFTPEKRWMDCSHDARRKSGAGIWYRSPEKRRLPKGETMDRESGMRNLFTRTRRLRTREEGEADIEAEPIEPSLMAEMGGTTEPEPLLAPQSVEREQWRGYVLICVNANVVKVCETVKERLGERFRGMSLVTGLYDLIVRVEADSKEQFKETLILVRETPGVISSVTLLDLN
jgi:hypothetical protein